MPPAGPIISVFLRAGFPCCWARMPSVISRIAGSAASVLGSSQFLVGGAIALLLGALPPDGFGYLPATLAVLAFGTLAAAVGVWRLRTK